MKKLSLILCLSTLAFGQSKIEKVLNKEKSTVKKSISSQKKIDRLDDEKQNLLLEYRQTLAKIDQLKAYNAQVEKLIDSQNDEKENIAIQIENLANVDKEILPLINEMLGNLSSFVKLDIPFLAEERNGRIANLESEVNSSKISTSEKFRRIMEAYKIENDYGKSIETYKSAVELDGKTLSADFLKVGRIALLFQTADGSKTGFWDKNSNSFALLDSGYKKQVQQGILIAKKQIAPNLLTLPISKAKEI